MKKEYIVVEWVPIQSALVALELVPSFANGVKGGSITLFVGIQAKLLIVDDVVINDDLFSFFLNIFFQENSSTWNPRQKSGSKMSRY